MASPKQQEVLDHMRTGSSFNKAYDYAGLSQYGHNRALFLQRMIASGLLVITPEDQHNRSYLEAYDFDTDTEGTLLINVTDEGIILDFFGEDGVVTKTAALDAEALMSLLRTAVVVM